MPVPLHQCLEHDQQHHGLEVALPTHFQSQFRVSGPLTADGKRILHNLASSTTTCIGAAGEAKGGLGKSGVQSGTPNPLTTSASQRLAAEQRHHPTTPTGRQRHTRATSSIQVGSQVAAQGNQVVHLGGRDINTWNQHEMGCDATHDRGT